MNRKAWMVGHKVPLQWVKCHGMIHPHDKGEMGWCGETVNTKDIRTMVIPETAKGYDVDKARNNFSDRVWFCKDCVRIGRFPAGCRSYLVHEEK